MIFGLPKELLDISSRISKQGNVMAYLAAMFTALALDSLRDDELLGVTGHI